jgi:hypothetical protein
MKNCRDLPDPQLELQLCDVKLSDQTHIKFFRQTFDKLNEITVRALCLAILGAKHVGKASEPQVIDHHSSAIKRHSVVVSVYECLARLEDER